MEGDVGTEDHGIEWFGAKVCRYNPTLPNLPLRQDGTVEGLSDLQGDVSAPAKLGDRPRGKSGLTATRYIESRIGSSGHLLGRFC
jgi:hypothetical protein